MEGFGPGKWAFCDETNHAGNPKDNCWAKVKARTRNAKHPNKGYPRDAPAPEVKPPRPKGRGFLHHAGARLRCAKGCSYGVARQRS